MKEEKTKISNQLRNKSRAKFLILNFIFVSLILILNFTFLGCKKTAPVSTTAVPKRIISLAPSITEIIFALGLGDRLVGVTTYCDYPEEAKKKPKIGGMINPSLEAIMNIKPDVVILTPEGNTKDVSERLKSLRIKTYTFTARRIYELPDAIRKLGRFLGAEERSEELASEIEKGLKKYKSTSKKNKKAIFIIWPEPLVVAGSGTAIDDAISLLGLENIASKAKVTYPKYSIEEIIYQSPDLIFIGRGHTDVKESSATLLKRISTTPAVRNNNVCYLSDSLYRLGPRVIKGIEEMSLCIR